LGAEVSDMTEPKRVLIVGAAGRDFHNFNTVFRDSSEHDVVAFTAAQIPDIDGRRYPCALAGPRYPQGIPIFAEDDLEDIIAREAVDEVVFSYSDVPYEAVMRLSSRALAAGADFRLLGPGSTSLKSRLPVVAVCAVRTGVGKSQTTRYIAGLLKKQGRKVAVVRHPMPYGDLEAQSVQRFANSEDLVRHRCTIEEREEYEPHIEAGHLVFAGVDYQLILEAAEAEADVILWDGGNNDLPFYRPSLHLTLVDPHRPGHELRYHPGEANLRMADVVVVTKVNTAEKENMEKLLANVRQTNPGAHVVETDSVIVVEGETDSLRGQRVLVVEDGPTLTHGEMGYGAGTLAAQGLGCQLVDPRPYAVGSIKDVFRKWKHLGPVLPAMGYSEKQCRELEQTIADTPADAVLIGTPIDLSSVLAIDKPYRRVRYDLVEREGVALEQLLRQVQ
jgi:predicted GTPase